MKLAYLILAHDNFEQLALMLNVLTHHDISFIIHVDSKTNVDLEGLRDTFNQNANVFFLDERLSITWGGSSIFEASISLIVEALNHGTYDYISLISGNDFPIKTSKEILTFLSDNNGKEYIEYHSLPYQNWGGNGGQDRYNFYWLIDEIGLRSSYQFVETQRKENSIRQFPKNLVPYGGSMWFTITTRCALHIYTSLANNIDLVLFFKYVMIPDEIVIPTIVLNSRFKGKVENNNLRYIDWSEGKAHPKTLTMVDLPRLKRSNCHLARKFDLAKDREIINALITSLTK